MDIGDRIRRIRLRKGYSQDYVAHKIGVSQNFYSKMELGKTTVTEQRLRQLANVLDESVSSILSEGHDTTSALQLKNSESFFISEAATFRTLKEHNKEFRKELARYLLLLRRLRG